MANRDTNEVIKNSSLRIQYPYAIDEYGILTYIGDVKKTSRHDHTFICPNCGNTMLPRLGEHNAHCFAHDSGKACNPESYIHKTAKRILARRFNEEGTFKVSFTTHRICEKSSECKHFDDKRCGYDEKQEYDLKTFYDLPAEIEYTIINNGKKFQPDVALLSSDKRRSPIFLEAFYTHKSTQEKITSNQCIEFRIRDFEDLHKLEDEPVVESDDIKFLNFKDIPVTPEQVEDYADTKEQGLLSGDNIFPFCKQSFEHTRYGTHTRRYILYKTGKNFTSRIRNEDKHYHMGSALADITYNLREKYFDPAYVLANKDQRFRTCHLCKHCKNTHSTEFCCELSPNYSAHINAFGHLKGNPCDSFEWADRFKTDSRYKTMLEDNIEWRDYSIWINPD